MNVERAVIASVFLRDEAAHEVATEVKPSDFSDPALREVYAAIVELARAKSPTDVATVISRLESEGRLAAVGGKHFIVGLMGGTVAPSKAAHYARTVRKLSAVRAFKSAAKEISEAMPAAEDAEEFLSSSQARLLSMAAGDPPNTFFTAKEWTQRFFADLERRATTKEPPALECGVYGVDAALALRPGALVVIAAMTSVGKSALAGQIAIGVAERGGHVLLSTLEMTIDQVVRRFVAYKANTDMTRLDYPHQFADHDWARVHNAITTFNDLHLSVWTERGLSIDKLRMRVMREHAIRPLKMLIVDYLQLVSGEGDSRANQVGAVSGGLKTLAGELDIPVVALSQFNRGATLTEEPQLHQLRDSGNIEQDADAVGLMWRTSDDGAEVALKFDKNRHGPKTRSSMRFDGSRQRFDD